jgi:hypothetical protein
MRLAAAGLLLVVTAPRCRAQVIPAILDGGRLARATATAKSGYTWVPRPAAPRQGHGRLFVCMKLQHPNGSNQPRRLQLQKDWRFPWSTGKEKKVFFF